MAIRILIPFFVGQLMHATTSTYSGKCCFTCFFLSQFLLVCPASAQLVQVPSLSGFGNSDNIFPFSTTSMRYQQIYSASAFSHGGIIDKIMFRNDDVHGDIYGPREIDLQVAFAYAATTVGTASNTFADNIGDDFTIVLDQVIVESHDGSNPPGTFDFVLDVADAFTYDPRLGDLLVQILVRDSELSASLDTSWSPQQDVTNRIWARGVDSITGRVGFSASDPRPYGLVSQFEFRQVPEPSPIPQVAVGLLLAHAVKRPSKRCSR